MGFQRTFPTRRRSNNWRGFCATAATVLPVVNAENPDIVEKSDVVGGVSSAGYPVKTLSGHELRLQTQSEQIYFISARDNYLSEAHYTVSTDLRDLDRLLLLEVQMFAAQTQLATKRSFSGLELSGAEQAELRKVLKETAPMVASIQDGLGLSKAKREANQATVAGYLQTLRERAKEFGVMRETQLGKALELMNSIFATAGAYKRSNAEERKKLGFESAEDVIDYMLEVAKPEFDAVDAHFRTHSQKFWIRTV
jgi:hypothetical protein